MLTNLVGKMVIGLVACSHVVTAYPGIMRGRTGRIRDAYPVEYERGACDTEQTCCVVGRTPLDIYGVREGLCGEGRLRGLARAVFGLVLLWRGPPERPLCGCRAEGRVQLREGARGCLQAARASRLSQGHGLPSEEGVESRVRLAVRQHLYREGSEVRVGVAIRDVARLYAGGDRIRGPVQALPLCGGRGGGRRRRRRDDFLGEPDWRAGCLLRAPRGAL